MESLISCLALAITCLWLQSVLTQEILSNPIPADDIDPEFTVNLNQLIWQSININLDQATWNESLIVTHQQTKWFPLPKDYTIVTAYTNISIRNLSKYIFLGPKGEQVLLKKNNQNTLDVIFMLRSSICPVTMDLESYWLEQQDKTLASGIIYDIWTHVTLNYNPKSVNCNFKCTNTNAKLLDVRFELTPPSGIEKEKLLEVTVNQLTPRLQQAVERAFKIMLSNVRTEPLKGAMDKYLSSII